MKYVLNIWTEELEERLLKFGNVIPQIDFKNILLNSLNKRDEYFFYISFPFCESLCNFCNIPVLIKSEKYLNTYTEYLISEVRYVLPFLDKKKISFYLGGGTWNLHNLTYLETFLVFLNKQGLNNIFVEIDIVPWNINYVFIDLLNKYDFKRKLNIGFQTLDNKVLSNINRTKQINLDLKDLFEKISNINNLSEVHFDFILGLFGERYSYFIRSLLDFTNLLKEYKLLLKATISVNKLDIVNNHFDEQKLEYWYKKNQLKIDTYINLAENLLNMFGISRDKSLYWDFVSKGKIIGVGLNGDGRLNKEGKILIYRNVAQNLVKFYLQN